MKGMKNKVKSKFWLLVVVVFLIMSLAGVNAAAKFPNKPITYVIPFAVGGESDITARLQQKYLEEILGVKVLIINKPGGGGALGWAECAAGKPDGYTVTGCNLPHTIVQPMESKDIGYQTDSLNLVYYFQNTPNVLAVPKDSPYNTLADFIKAAKEKPLNLGGSASNSANHLGVLQLNKVAKVKITYIPFSGTGTAVPALLGKHVAGLMTYTTVGVNYAKEIKVLAVATEKRWGAWPDVPTFKEQGFNVVEGAYRGVAVPPGTPPAVMKVLEDAFEKVNRNPEFVKKMEEMGFIMENYGVRASKKLVAEGKKHYSDLLTELLNKK